MTLHEHAVRMASDIMNRSYGTIYEALVQWIQRALEAEAKLADRVRPEMRDE